MITIFKSDGFTIKILKYRQLYIGIGLVILSFFMPFFFTVDNFGVLEWLIRGLYNGEVMDLMMAAVQLVALNTIRGIPHYVGVYFIGEAIAFSWRGRTMWWINAGVIMVILQITYWGIGQIHHIQYDFGIPAVAVSLLVVFFGKINYQHITATKKALQIVVFLTAFQFLDVMPATWGLPVGRGETSWDIKQSAIVLNAETPLDIMVGVFSVLFILFGILIFFQLRQENNLRRLAYLEKENTEIIIRAQLNEMQNRTNREMQHLVHDLKSPLTAIQTLVGLLKMRGELEKREKDVEYLDRIESGVARMSSMVSEILYEDQCTRVSISDIFRSILAQISITQYASCVETHNQIPDETILVNQFLFPRVLVNLIENSSHAIEGRTHPKIELQAHYQQRGADRYVCIAVTDNGVGIPKEKQASIWERSVSGTESTGLGLAFVLSVVEKMGGEIQLESVVQQGTTVSIFLPNGG